MLTGTDRNFFWYQIFLFLKLFQVGKAGKIVGIEHINALVADSKKNINKHHRDLLESGRVVIVRGDGRKGYAPEAPYDAIHVGAAAPEIPPEVHV